MATKKPTVEKPLTDRQQNEHRLFCAIVNSLAPQILNAKDGEVWRLAIQEAKQGNDAFYAERVS